MNRVESILFITVLYPSPAQPNKGTFVRQLVEAVAELNVRCTVVHPLKLHEWWRERRQTSAGGDARSLRAQILRPLCLSLSNRQLGPFNSFQATHYLFRRAVWRAVRRLEHLPDATYGHFLYSAGETAVWTGRRLGVPCFVAVGEGTFWSVDPLGTARAQRDFQDASGVIAVSHLLRRRLNEQLLIPAKKIAVFPNGVDVRRFYRRERLAMRRKYRLPEDTFLVIYIGGFIESKGVWRVDQALEGLKGVGGVFLGSGPCLPQGANVVFCDKVSHEQVPEFLSAADCFVLPSDVEGSCNAILEAMACGVPCIVSDGEFNDELVGNDCALRVRFDDVAAIRQAILRIHGDKALARDLSNRAAAKARALTIQDRAARILEFIRQSSTRRGDS